ncbi:MAG TPA: type II toxin-antitoxin system CcdA family antitoxin [Steroidobacteraceae bacterium]|nr:type II toxin-antitoxin system CcdA family antitoxin [Steroidobacteraceae bacterium]
MDDESLRRPKRPVNVAIRPELLAAAREAGFNLSALLERALEEELVRLKWRRWRRENARAIEAYNRHVKEDRPFSKILLRW